MLGIWQARVASLKREEEALAKERERLEVEKQRHLRQGSLQAPFSPAQPLPSALMSLMNCHGALVW